MLKKLPRLSPLDPSLPYLKLSNEVLYNPVPQEVSKLDTSKLKVQLLLSIFRHFKFDLSYF